jgi:hypothetical protein
MSLDLRGSIELVRTVVGKVIPTTSYFILYFISYFIFHFIFYISFYIQICNVYIHTLYIIISNQLKYLVNEATERKTTKETTAVVFIVLLNSKNVSGQTPVKSRVNTSVRTNTSKIKI